MLDKKTFEQIIKNTPLISIDLIVKDGAGKILLGKRKNEPAKNFWFVPGGRIFKDESIEDAFKRLCKNELNHTLKIDDATFVGVYEHFYENNVFNNQFSTHYIVLTYEIQIIMNNIVLPLDQHSEYIWHDVDTILKDGSVHQYTKNYFTGVKK